MNSTFDQGISDTFHDGVIPEMGDTITIKGVTIDCNVTERSTSSMNIQGGVKKEVNAIVEVLRSDFVRTGGNKNDVVTFSDGMTGKISSVDDFASEIYTLHIGARLDGATGQW